MSVRWCVPLPFLILSRLDSDLPSHLPANLPPQASDAASSKKREAFRAAQERQAQVLAWQQSMGITTMPALPPLPAPAKRGRPRQTDIDQKNAQKRPPMKRTKKAANTLPLPPPSAPCLCFRELLPVIGRERSAQRHEQGEQSCGTETITCIASATCV